MKAAHMNPTPPAPDPEEQAIVRAAYDHVDQVRATADGASPYPYWYGWALREAFMAGVEWQKRRDGERAAA